MVRTSATEKLVSRLILLFLAIIILSPLAIVLLVSLLNASSLNLDFSNLQWTWENWKYIFGLVHSDFPILRWFLNSVIVAGTAASLILILSTTAAYSLSRFRFWGRARTLKAILLVQLFPSAMAMVALYKMLDLWGRMIPGIGTDTLGGLILIYLGSTPFSIWLIKGYFDSLPMSVEEAALLDGCTPWGAFLKIVVPLSRPILAVVWLLSFIAIFSDFVIPSVLLKSQENFTLAVGMQIFVADAFASRWGQFAAASILGATPVVVAFIWVHKYLVSGLSTGAVKG